MKILFVGGGTAGHIMPALSIAERLAPSDTAYFILREGGRENEPVYKAGYPAYHLKVFSLSGGILSRLKGILALPSAKYNAKRIIKEIMPDAVFATGGYVSYPALSSARGLGIPTVIHEANIKSGLVTRLFGKYADLLFLPEGTLDSGLASLPQAHPSGTPIRRAFFELGYSEARRALGISENQRLIISQGGSLGADRLNCACLSLMRGLCAKTKDIIHIHSTGVRYFDKVKAEANDLSAHADRCKILPYLENMPLYLSAADLIICRAGASSIAELKVCGTPAILIPSPNVKDDHQSKNALGLLKGSPALVIRESELTDELLYDGALRLLNDLSLRKSLYKNTKAKKLMQDEARKILDEIAKLV